MKKLNKNNGITLIALVITIIVMLILVAVSISMAVNGGLFSYAGKATGDTQKEINAEKELADGRIKVDGVWYDTIDKYLAKEPSANQGDGTGTGSTMKSYEETEKDASTGVLKANAEYKSVDYTAVIPKGFKIIPGINNTTTIADGLVIQDAEGNEFVWVPVEVTENDTATSIASFYRSAWSNNARTTGLSENYTEPFTNGYTNETEEYNDMLKSVYHNKGFYIGRYEAGSETARTDKANGTTKMVVQRDKYPYNYVGWGQTMSDYTSNVTGGSEDQGLGALALSKAMYANKDVGVTSTLCYGVMWDAMLDFIKDDSHNVTNSTTWGNYKNNTGDTWKIERPTAKWTTSPSSDTEWTTVGETAKEKTTSDDILLTTGANDNFSAKNIYDVAGNVNEWTNEAYSTDFRVSRGGNCGSYGGSLPASNRGSGIPYVCFVKDGFRPALYIK